MTTDQLINIGILLGTIFPFTYGLHIANVRRGERLSLIMRDIQKRLRKHDRRVKRNNKRIRALEQAKGDC